MSHIIPNGEGRPIAFASRTLSKNKLYRNYAQIEEEALISATTKKRYSDTTIQRYTEPEPGAGARAARKLFKLINYLTNYCSQSPQETLVVVFSGGGAYT